MVVTVTAIASAVAVIVEVPTTGHRQGIGVRLTEVVGHGVRLVGQRLE
jgi:hypothetical protein